MFIRLSVQLHCTSRYANLFLRYTMLSKLRYLVQKLEDHGIKTGLQKILRSTTFFSKVRTLLVMKGKKTLTRHLSLTDAHVLSFK